VVQQKHTEGRHRQHAGGHHLLNHYKIIQI